MIIINFSLLIVLEIKLVLDASTIHLLTPWSSVLLEKLAVL
jgi:hypothetical protein